jgi:PEGA domain
MIRFTCVAGVASALTLVLGVANVDAQSRGRAVPRHPTGVARPAPVGAGGARAVPRYPVRSVHGSPGRSGAPWRGVAVPRSPYRGYYGYKSYASRPYARAYGYRYARPYAYYPYYGYGYRSHFYKYPYYRYRAYYPISLGFTFGAPFYWAGLSFGYPAYTYAYPYAYPAPAYPAASYPTYDPRDYDVRVEAPQPEVEKALPPGRIALDVNPPDAEVYVDGYYVGVVTDFSGAQQLTVDAGARRIEFRAPGHETLALQVLVSPGQTITVRRELRAAPR